MFCGYSHLLVALIANRSLAELAEDPSRKKGKSGAQTQEANLALFHVLLDVNVHWKPFEFGLGHNRADMYNLLQRKRQPIIQIEGILPLVLVQRVLGPGVQGGHFAGAARQVASDTTAAIGDGLLWWWQLQCCLLGLRLCLMVVVIGLPG